LGSFKCRRLHEGNIGFFREKIRLFSILICSTACRKRYYLVLGFRAFLRDDWALLRNDRALLRDDKEETGGRPDYHSFQVTYIFEGLFWEKV